MLSQHCRQHTSENISFADIEIRFRNDALLKHNGQPYAVAFWKCLFHLPKEKASSNDKQIVLAYPTPRLLTYTDKKLEYLQSGNTFDGYTVMLWDDFLNFLKSSREGNHE